MFYLLEDVLSIVMLVYQGVYPNTASQSNNHRLLYSAAPLAPAALLAATPHRQSERYGNNMQQ